MECFGHIVSLTQIQEPDAGFCFVLLQIRTAIGGKGEGHLVFTPCTDLILGIFRTDIPGIVLALVVQHRGNVLVFCLGFNGGYQLQANEQGIVRITFLTNGGVSGPLSNGHVMTFCGAATLGVANLFSIGFPTNLTQLLVDHVTGFCFGFLPLACSLAGLLFTLRGYNRRCCGSHSFGLFCQLLFSFLFFLLISNRHSLFFHRHDKGLVLVIPVTIGLHEPFTEAVCHLQ